MNDRRKNDKSIESTKEEVHTPTIAIVLSNDNITNKNIIRFRRHYAPKTLKM